MGAAGAGAGAYGVHEATKDDDVPPADDAKPEETSAQAPGSNPGADDPSGGIPEGAGGLSSSHDVHSPVTEQTGDSAVTTSPDATLSKDKGDGDHYGRDAAVAGGLGAGGVGAYELSKDREEPQPESTQPQLVQSEQVKPQETTPAVTDSEPTEPTKPEATKAEATEPKEDDTHYGRDAAVAGGTAAVGVRIPLLLIVLCRSSNVPELGVECNVLLSFWDEC